MPQCRHRARIGVLLCAAGWTVAAAPSADESDGRGIEEVVVIGSQARIESLADELPVPVDLHQSADLDRTGESDLGASLAKLSPSFNFSRLSIGDGALMNPATLRGLAPDQTLVLVNGKRRHGMAWLRILDGVIGYGTGGTDLRALPAAAVERVEVLRDAASAQYGSDAIAGVLNLALKERTGADIAMHAGTGGDAGGDRRSLSFNGGIELGADGFRNVTAQWLDNDVVLRNGGNGGLDPDYQDELIPDSEPANDARSLFFNAEVPVGDGGALYAFGGASRREGDSSGAYRFRYNYWEGLRSGDATWDFVVPNFVNFHERNTHPVYPDGFLPRERSAIDDRSLVAGWRGSAAGWELDVSAATGRNEFSFGASNTINASIGAHYLARNPGADVGRIVANAGPRSGHSGSIEYEQTTLNADARRTFGDGALSAVGIGIERRTETYRQKAGDEAAWSCGLPHAEDYGAFAVDPGGRPIDGVVAACGFQGYPGYSPRNAELGRGGRDSLAAYIDLESRPTDNLTLGAAVRAEDYSDAGGNATFKLAARVELSRAVSLRAAAATGFRAPSLSQRRFNSILFVGSETGLTTVFSANEGHPVARAFGVDALDHETSRNFIAGLVYAPSDNARVTVDAYLTDIADRVVRSQGLGCASLAACQAERVATTAFFFNGVDTRTRGFDVAGRLGAPVGGGYLWLSAALHANRTEITGSSLPAGAPPGVGFDDYFGGWAAEVMEEGQPRVQASVGADWERGPWSLTGRVNHYGETVQHPLDTGRIEVDAASTVDLEVRRRIGAAEVAVGVSNVGDRLPTPLPKTHLSNVLWGVAYPTDTPFSLVGRYGYVRAAWRFGR